MDESLKEKLQELGVLTDVEKYVQAEKQTSFQAGVGKSYEEVDRAVEEVFGVKKEGKQMTTEFLKSAVSMHEQGLTVDIEKKFKGIKEENKTLKEQIAKIPDASEYNSLREAHNKALKEHEQVIASLKNEFETKEKIGKVSQAISAIPLDFPDNDYRQFKINQFTEKLKSDGLLETVVEADGKVILKGGEKHGHKDFVLSEMVQETFKPYIKGEEQETIKTGEPIPASSKLASVKTKGEALGIIRETLVQNGYKVTDDNWSNVYQKELEANKETLENLE